jgi:hypothetical protein
MLLLSVLGAKDVSMHVILLLLGAIIIAAGAALVASGISAPNFTFGSNMVTPGTIAAIGGLIVMALGIAVRVLNRIERALTAWPVQRLALATEPPAVSPNEQPAERAERPAAPALENEVHPQSAAVAAAALPTSSIAFESLREKFQTLARAENRAPADTTVVSMLPRTSPRSDEESGEFKNGHAAGRPNVIASERAAPRLEVISRPASGSPRPKTSMFDSFWPKARQQSGGAQAAQVAPLPAVEPAQHGGPWPSAEPAVVQHEESVTASILKSGVVDGMAYTLYADGAIEAQLPQGTLRFRSIAELRKYLDQGA